MITKELTLEAIAERIDGLRMHINEKFRENFAGHAEMTKTINDVHLRVNRLELWRAFVVGGIAFSGFLVGGAWALLTFFVEKWS